MYFEKIGQLLKTCDNEDREDVAHYVANLVEYTNRIVVEGAMLMMAGAKMDQQEYVEYAQIMYAARNSIHDTACRAVDAINKMAQRHHMGEIFEDFKLEKANDPTRTVIYNGESHRAARDVCAILCNELYHEASIGLEQLLMDKIAQRDVGYAILSADELQQKAEEFEKKHYGINLSTELTKADCDELQLTLFDGGTVNVCVTDKLDKGICNRDEEGTVLSADCQFSLKEYNSMKLGEAAAYVGNDGVAYEVPVSVIADCIKRHGGIKEVEEIEYSLELTREEQIKEIAQGMVQDMHRYLPLKNKFEKEALSLSFEDQNIMKGLGSKIQQEIQGAINKGVKKMELQGAVSDEIRRQDIEYGNLLSEINQGTMSGNMDHLNRNMYAGMKKALPEIEKTLNDMIGKAGTGTMATPVQDRESI